MSCVRFSNEYGLLTKVCLLVKLQVPKIALRNPFSINWRNRTVMSIVEWKRNLSELMCGIVVIHFFVHFMSSKTSILQKITCLLANIVWNVHKTVCILKYHLKLLVNVIVNIHIIYFESVNYMNSSYRHFHRILIYAWKN